MADNEARPSKDLPRTPWNKGKLIGAKPPTAAKARLVNQDPTDGRGTHERPRHVQFGDRQ